jgi:hypothetical protein
VKDFEPFGFYLTESVVPDKREKKIFITDIRDYTSLSRLGYIFADDWLLAYMSPRVIGVVQISERPNTYPPVVSFHRKRIQLYPHTTAGTGILLGCGKPAIIVSRPGDPEVIRYWIGEEKGFWEGGKIRE